MNPGTDIGKKELPINVKSKFSVTTIHELTDKNDLIDFVKGLIGNSFDVSKIVDIYLNLKLETKSHHFESVTHTFSLRNLSRALHYFRNSSTRNSRDMFNGLSLAFGSGLNKESLEMFHA